MDTITMKDHVNLQDQSREPINLDSLNLLKQVEEKAKQKRNDPLAMTTE